MQRGWPLSVHGYRVAPTIVGWEADWQDSGDCVGKAAFTCSMTLGREAPSLPSFGVHLAVFQSRHSPYVSPIAKNRSRLRFPRFEAIGMTTTGAKWRARSTYQRFASAHAIGQLYLGTQAAWTPRRRLGYSRQPPG
jgi:hypothetical protein